MLLDASKYLTQTEKKMCGTCRSDNGFKDLQEKMEACGLKEKDIEPDGT